MDSFVIFATDSSARPRHDVQDRWRAFLHTSRCKLLCGVRKMKILNRLRAFHAVSAMGVLSEFLEGETGLVEATPKTDYTGVGGAQIRSNW